MTWQEDGCAEYRQGWRGGHPLRQGWGLGGVPLVKACKSAGHLLDVCRWAAAVGWDEMEWGQGMSGARKCLCVCVRARACVCVRACVYVYVCMYLPSRGSGASSSLISRRQNSAW